MLEPLKYLIQCVAIERDPLTQRVVREVPAETISVFSAEEAHEKITQFEHELRNLNEREGENAGNRDNGAAHHLRQPDVSGQPVGSGGQDRLDVRD